jgi:TIGR03009 family protein
MRRIMTIVLTSAIGIWTAGSAFGQAGRPALPNNPAGAPGQVQNQGQGIVPPGAAPQKVADARGAMARMDELLRQWEQRSSTIKTLDAKFTREDLSPAWGTKELYVGRAILKSPDYAFLDFQKVNGAKAEAYEQIRCTGKEVYHYRSDNHQIFIYPMPAQKQQRALQEGPLPFLFDMRAEEAKKRYHMTIDGENLTHVVIKIFPREEIDREAFVRADVVLNKEKFLPDAIRLYAPNGKDYQTYNFGGKDSWIKANESVNEQNFEGVILKGWKVEHNPGGDGRTPSGTAAGPGRRPQPAMRPGPQPPRR